MKIPRLKKGESCVVAFGKSKATITNVGTYSPGSLPQWARSESSPQRKGCGQLGSKLSESFPPGDGLGDAISNILATVGITKDRWADVVATFTMKKQENKDGCGGCNWRQKLMNYAGTKLGLPEGKGAELQKLIELTKLPKQTVYACSEHGQCLTQLILSGDARVVIENAGYHLCHGCTEFQSNESNP